MNYVARDSAARAVKLVNRLLAAPRQLEHTPKLGRVVPEIGQAEIRELVTVRPYRIIYSLRNTTCAIVAVIHGSRDLLSALQQVDWEEM
jgi:plasmid stabilization system protein ParE